MGYNSFIIVLATGSARTSKAMHACLSNCDMSIFSRWVLLWNNHCLASFKPPCCSLSETAFKLGMRWSWIFPVFSPWCWPITDFDSACGVLAFSLPYSMRCRLHNGALSCAIELPPYLGVLSIDVCARRAPLISGWLHLSTPAALVWDDSEFMLLPAWGWLSRYLLFFMWTLGNPIDYDTSVSSCAGNMFFRTDYAKKGRKTYFSKWRLALLSFKKTAMQSKSRHSSLQYRLCWSWCIFTSGW